MAQRFKSKNPGAVIPLLPNDLLIAGATPSSNSGGFRYSRARIERSGYAERADYCYLPSGMEFEHVEVHLTEDAINSLGSALESLALYAPHFSPPSDPDETVRSLRFWVGAQAVELFAPLRHADAHDIEPLSLFTYLWQIIDAVIPPSPKTV